jgi:hypothetical protein
MRAPALSKKKGERDAMRGSPGVKTIATGFVLLAS